MISFALGEFEVRPEDRTAVRSPEIDRAATRIKRSRTRCGGRGCAEPPTPPPGAADTDSALLGPPSTLRNDAGKGEDVAIKRGSNREARGWCQAGPAAPKSKFVA